MFDTVGFGHEYDRPEEIGLSDTEGVRTRAAARWKGFELYIKNIFTLKSVSLINKNIISRWSLYLIKKILDI